MLLKSIIIGICKRTWRKLASYAQLMRVHSSGKVTLITPFNAKLKRKAVFWNGNTYVGENADFQIFDTMSYLQSDEMVYGRDSRFICKGKLIFQGKGFTGRGIMITVEETAECVFGFNTIIGSYTYITINEQKNKFGENFSIGNYSKLVINSQWHIGNYCKIGDNCLIESREKGGDGALILEDGSQIGNGAFVDTYGNVVIRKGAILGPNCVIYTHNHDYKKVIDGPLGKGLVLGGDVTIGENCWIGANVTILAGVTIGEKSVVAAGAVVVRSLEPNSLYAGVPAKFVKYIQ